MDRSENMRRIRSKDTKPEIFLRKLLHSRGFRYSLNSNKVPGHPDLWMPKYNLAVFVNGCFWHRHEGCPYAYTPKSRIEFWETKFENNIKRDAVVKKELEEKGIRRLVVWECTLKAMRKKNSDELRDSVMNEIEQFIRSDEPFAEI